MQASLISVILYGLAFLAGIVLTGLFSRFFRHTKQKNIKSDISFLQFERDHREMIRDSKIHRDRVARRSVFTALFFLGLVIIITFIVVVIAPTFLTTNEGITFPPLDSGIYIFPVILWTLYLVFVFYLWQRYKSINNFQRHLYKIDEMIVKASKKLDRESK